MGLLQEVVLPNGERAEYPGHPLVIAYLITEVFPDFKAAMRRRKTLIYHRGGKPVYREEYPECMTDIRIPGAGGCVWSAISILRHLREGADLNLVIAEAKRVWGGTDNMLKSTDPEKQKRYKKGCKQASLIENRFRQKKDWWKNDLQVQGDITNDQGNFIQRPKQQLEHHF